ncbi:MAG: type I restriction-modification system subunit M [Aridibacter sp.]
MQNFRDKANLIWDIADLLRGRYYQSDYGKVILPFTVLRRLDVILEPTKKEVLASYKINKEKSPKTLEHILKSEAKASFYNHSKFDFYELAQDHNNIGANLRNYINGFSEGARDIFIEYFKFDEQIEKLEKYNLLYLVISKFVEEDVTQIMKTVTSMEMGYIFEELIRKFAEASNETAGEHFTPREVIKLMVNLLFREDTNDLTKEKIIKTIYDPACGTGGMLSVAEEYLNHLNPQSRLEVFGQEINPESYAICKSDMLIKGQNVANMKFGNTFSEDGLKSENFDYMLSNPPFGVNWRNAEDEIKAESEKMGYAGRFGAGLPSISDGSLLFLQNMLSKMKAKKDGGSRLAIVFNGSPLFSGGAGSGQSEIRRWIIENDWLEAIIALPDQLFYNTGISTYIWVLSNDKSIERKGKVQLVNTTGAEAEDKNNPFYLKMLRSLGNKRKKIGDKDEGDIDQIGHITNLYFELEENDVCKIFDNHEFGYWRITVERPLRLNFQTSPERIAKIEALNTEPQKEYENVIEEIKKVFPDLDDLPTKEKQTILKAKKKYLKDRVFEQDELEELKEALAKLDETKLYKDRKVFLKVFNKALKDTDYKPTGSQKKKILDQLSERDQTAEICYNSKGEKEADSELRDYENVPLIAIPKKDANGEDEIDRDTIEDYFRREVLPHVADAWIDWSKTKIGYEINITKYFYKYKPLRNLSEIRADILALEDETDGMIKKAVGV